MSLLMFVYVVSNIFTVIIKISNYSSPGPTKCQAQSRRHAEAIDADSEAHRPGFA